MSAALVRQALDFVDPDERGVKNKKRGVRPCRAAPGQVKKPQKHHLKRLVIPTEKAEKQRANTAARKLLKLSCPTVDTKIRDKIVDRAVKGKPLTDKIEVNDEPQKSILFPDEEFDQFEEELFCS